MLSDSERPTKMRIKLISLILLVSLLMSFCCLTACKKKENNKGVDTDAQQTEETCETSYVNATTYYYDVKKEVVDVTDKNGKVIGSTVVEKKYIVFETIPDVTEPVTVIRDKDGNVIGTSRTTQKRTTTAKQTISTPKGANPLTSKISGSKAPQLVSVSLPAYRGSEASIIISGEANKDYVLSSDFKSEGMGTVKSNSVGIASWSIDIPQNTKKGDHIFKISYGENNFIEINITVA